MSFRDWAEKHQTNVSVSQQCHLTGEKLVIGGKRVPLAGASARFETGATIGSRITATRVAAGAVLLGPLGALLGGMAKKDASKLYIVVESADGVVYTDEVKAKHEKKVRQLVANINVASVRLAPPYVDAKVVAAEVTPPPPTVPAGWHPDPEGYPVQRYWDGSAWTAHTAPLG